VIKDPPVNISPFNSLLLPAFCQKKSYNEAINERSTWGGKSLFTFIVLSDESDLSQNIEEKLAGVFREIYRRGSKVCACNH
jgi:hypothetical protein